MEPMVHFYVLLESEPISQVQTASLQRTLQTTDWTSTGKMYNIAPPFAGFDFRPTPLPEICIQTRFDHVLIEIEQQPSGGEVRKGKQIYIFAYKFGLYSIPSTYFTTRMLTTAIAYTNNTPLIRGFIICVCKPKDLPATRKIIYSGWIRDLMINVYLTSSHWPGLQLTLFFYWWFTYNWWMVKMGSNHNTACYQ